MPIRRHSHIHPPATLAAAWLLLLLAGYAGGRLVTDARPRWDDALGAALRGQDDRALTHIMRAITVLGSAGVLDAVFVAAILLLLVGRRVRDAAFVGLSSGGAVLLERLLKRLVDRPRPTAGQLVSAHGPSWPSGHASSSLALYGALTLVAVAQCRAGPGRRPLARRALVVAAAVIVALIGLSRVELGVHHPSDVAAGWMLAGGWLAALAVVRARAR